MCAQISSIWDGGILQPQVWKESMNWDSVGGNFIGFFYVELPDGLDWYTIGIVIWPMSLWCCIHASTEVVESSGPENNGNNQGFWSKASSNGKEPVEMLMAELMTNSKNGKASNHLPCFFYVKFLIT
jgi:hypothetical protein